MVTLDRSLRPPAHRKSGLDQAFAAQRRKPGISSGTAGEPLPLSGESKSTLETTHQLNGESPDARRPNQERTPPPPRVPDHADSRDDQFATQRRTSERTRTTAKPITSSDGWTPDYVVRRSRTPRRSATRPEVHDPAQHDGRRSPRSPAAESEPPNRSLPSAARPEPHTHALATPRRKPKPPDAPSPLDGEPNSPGLARKALAPKRQDRTGRTRTFPSHPAHAAGRRASSRTETQTVLTNVSPNPRSSTARSNPPRPPDHGGAICNPAGRRLTAR